MINTYQTPQGALKGQLDWLPGDSDSQTSETIALMRKYAVADSTHPLITERVDSDLIPRIRTGSSVCDAVHQHVKQSIDFVDDSVLLQSIKGPGIDSETIEVLQRPADIEHTIQSFGKATGDCDDFSMYCAALLLSLASSGFPVSNVRFVTISPRGMVLNDKDFAHVFVRFTSNGRDIDMDCSHGNYAGWAYRDNNREMEWPVGSSISSILAALVGVALIVIIPNFRIIGRRLGVI